MSTLLIRYKPDDEERLRKAYITALLIGGDESALQVLRRNNIVRSKITSWNAQIQQSLEMIKPWQPGEWAVEDTSLLYEPEGKVYRVIQGHMISNETKPNESASLYRPAPVTVLGRKYPLWNSIGLMDGANTWRIDARVDWNGLYWRNTIDYNVWEPGTENSGWVWLPDDNDTMPPVDDCANTPLWNINDHLLYVANYEVKHNNKIWKANPNNLGFTWIAPALSGDGSLSWIFVKDCI